MLQMKLQLLLICRTKLQHIISKQICFLHGFPRFFDIEELHDTLISCAKALVSRLVLPIVIDLKV